jgi:hypothetical protein
MTDTEQVKLECLGLTSREAEVLAWVAQGKSNHAIGVILGISPRTVQKHLKRTFLSWSREPHGGGCPSSGYRVDENMSHSEDIGHLAYWETSK